MIQHLNRAAHKPRLKQFWVWAVIFSALSVIFLGSMLLSARRPAGPLPIERPIYNLDAITPHDIPADDWRLLLVNADNPLPADYEITLTRLANGLEVEVRCYPDLQAMMDACRAEGLSPVICSAYRSYDKQQSLFLNKVADYIEQGYSEAMAEQEAAQVVAIPGYSEHQSGLALDIVDFNNQNLDESQQQTQVQQWLMAHSWEYGFVMRYPLDKSEITGIIYEPWHYRYVGQEAARIMYEQNLCLEEYIALLKEEKVLDKKPAATLMGAAGCFY